MFYSQGYSRTDLNYSLVYMENSKLNRDMTCRLSMLWIVALIIDFKVDTSIES